MIYFLFKMTNLKNFNKIKEGEASVLVPKNVSKISKDLPVFYNPVMEFNRTLSIELLRVLRREELDIALPLSGTGVRGVRMLLELPFKLIRTLYLNDYDKDAIKIIKKNIKLNNLSSEKIIYSEQDANNFLLSNKAYDYIDIDPFGSPNPFLNNAIMRLKRKGILAVTATDTAALCGSWKNPCYRKYWATPLHTEEMHEAGLRILIRKVQLIGVQFEKALFPILSYSKDHYMRVFFICIKGKKRCDEIILQHGMYKDAGPMWLGKIKYKDILKTIKLEKCLKKDNDFLQILINELDVLGFYDVPTICSDNKLKTCKKLDFIIEKIRSKGFEASRTQFAQQGIKSNISYDEILKILK
jgi:tRNA (guanine26-N2/guanine27-N2)-dimethyltransferase